MESLLVLDINIGAVSKRKNSWITIFIKHGDLPATNSHKDSKNYPKKWKLKNKNNFKINLR